MSFYFHVSLKVSSTTVSDASDSLQICYVR